MFGKVLVPIDGSEPSWKALDHALQLAENCGSEVVILSVVPPIVYPLLSEESPDATIFSAREIDRLNAQMKAGFEKVLREGAERAGESKPKVRVSTKLAEGRPGNRIVEVAKEGGFDLIVMGSRGLSGLSEFILGSTTHHVADNCTCPLLIVK